MRGIPSQPKNLSAEVEGDIEDIDGVMVITKIRVRYRMKVPKGKRDKAERALATHEQKCPAATSIKRGIEVEWSADIEEI